MATVSELRTAIATAMETIPGLRTSATVPTPRAHLSQW
jgi:hypothetical protein